MKFPIRKNTKCESSPNTEKYGPDKSPYLDTFHAVNALTF